MPVSTRSKSTMALKPLSKAEWDAVEALVLIKNTPSTLTQPSIHPRPHRSSATYTPGKFAGMEE